MLGHKVFHRIFREKFLELTVQLSSEGLIVRYYQSGLVQRLYDIGHGKGLARTRHTKQRLKLVALLEAFHKGFDGGRLVAGGLVFTVQYELILSGWHEIHLLKSLSDHDDLYYSIFLKSSFDYNIPL